MSTHPACGGDDSQWWRGWTEKRPMPAVTHLDSAAAGRSTESVLQAVYDHAVLEATVGAYVAEEMAKPVIEAGRAALGTLLGVPSDGVALVESASVALRILLSVWPLRTGDTVAVAPSEWGPNLEAFVAHGLEIVEIRTVGDGRIDLDHLQSLLAASPPAIVHLTQVASHRALVQPVSESAELCQSAGVPLWVDAAQALGHVDTACGADAVYSTSRKWLTGPRGVGILAIAEPWWEKLVIRVPTMAGEGLPVVRNLESHEAHVAGRVGLSVAVREYAGQNPGPAAIWARLRDVGRATREAMSELRGWEVVGPFDAPCAITALRPTDGQDPVSTRERLIAQHGIVTTAAAVARAPREMTTPLLRISPHVDCSDDNLVGLRAALP
ncbi:MAG: aminotransferase class V-fold PLP-dependent enzyme [Acidimicrobiales bacterium]